MKRKVLLILAAALLCAYTKPEHVQRALEAAGYTKVQVNGYAWIGCDKNDTFADKFTAVGVNGTVVSGVVCSG